MKNILAFSVRNTKLFFRDKAVFFFSLLSSLILILLYFLFIANIYVDMIKENIPFISESGASFVVYLQMMASVLVLNSISLSLGMFTGMAKDFESQRLNSFLTTPVKKRELLISYFLSGIVVSFILNFFTWIITILLIGALTGFWITISTFLLAMVVLIVSSLISSSITILLTVTAKSSTALGVINGVAGTFLGFLCGIYMPYSQLGKGVEAVGSFFPFTHLSIWFKNIVLTDAFSQINITGSAKDILMNDLFAANGVGFCGLDAPQWLMLLLSGVIAAVCLCISGLLLKKRIKSK